MKTNNVTLVLTPETEEEGLELVETAEILGSKGIRDLRVMPPWAKEWATAVSPDRNPLDTLAMDLFPLKVIYSAWLWERNQKKNPVEDGTVIEHQSFLEAWDTVASFIERKEKTR